MRNQKLKTRNGAFTHTPARVLLKCALRGEILKTEAEAKRKKKKNAHLLIEINFMICARPEAREKRASKKIIFSGMRIYPSEKFSDNATTGKPKKERNILFKIYIFRGYENYGMRKKFFCLFIWMREQRDEMKIKNRTENEQREKRIKARGKQEKK